MKIYAFNDMVGKGWDSAAQFSFCIQESLKGNPQFWWVKEVLRKFPHPPAWEHVDRNPDGTYKSFPGGKKSMIQKHLIRLASMLLGKNYKEEARQILKLADDAETSEQFEASWEAEEEKKLPQKPKRDLRKEEEGLMEGVRSDLLKMQRREISQEKEVIWDSIEQYKQHLQKGEYDKARELFETLSPEAKDLAIIEAQKIFAAINIFKKLAHILIQKGHKNEARQIINLLRSSNE